MSVAPGLAATQRMLQRLILSDAPTAPDVVQADNLAEGSERLSIYTSAYRLRLIEALGANYPMLQTHLGQDWFGELALAYLDDHPSTYVSIRAFGMRLPEWLARHRPTEPWLTEFAALEWALGCAFDALDSPAIGLEALASVRPEAWATLTFAFSPAVHRMSFKTNAASLYEAAANAQTAPAGREIDASAWLVWRRDFQAQFRSLAPDEAIAIDTLFAGGGFADACERMAEIGDEDSVPLRAAAFLKRWLLDEIVVAIRNGVTR